MWKVNPKLWYNIRKMSKEESVPRMRTLCIVHVFYPDFWPEIASCLRSKRDGAYAIVENPARNALYAEEPGVTTVRASIWARGYRRSSICGLRFPDGVFGADDWMFTMRVMQRIEKYANIPETVYLHRRHPDGISSAMPMRYIVDMLNAVRTMAGEWCDEGHIVSREEFARALAGHVHLWGVMLPSLKKYTAQEERELSNALRSLRAAGLVPFVSFGHAVRYFLVRHGLKWLLPLLWPKRFKKMEKIRNNHAEEVG